MRQKKGALLPFAPKKGQGAYGAASLSRSCPRTEGGRCLRLKKPLKRGGLKRLRAPSGFWRCLNACLSGTGKAGKTGGADSPGEDRLNLWRLVLTAKKIPHRVLPASPGFRLYVPCLYEGLALHEIRAVEAERPIPLHVPPVRQCLPGVLAVLCLLSLWHGLRFHWFAGWPPLPASFFPPEAEKWPALFGLDMRAFRQGLEFWRAGTALTLHADAGHLVSNVGFGLIFLTALCRRAGFGLGILLTILGGLCGNVLNATLQPLTDALSPWPQAVGRNVISIGFSTALFASMGALCALSAADIIGHHKRFAHLRRETPGLVPALFKRMAVPVAAGLALLGILGGGGEAKTDYSAHIWGFFCGLGVAWAALPLDRALYALEKAQEKAQPLSLQERAWTKAAPCSGASCPNASCPDASCPDASCPDTFRADAPGTGDPPPARNALSASFWPQSLLFCAALALPVLCWLYALARDL